MSRYLCDVAPLSCPRHLSAVGRCDPLSGDILLASALFPHPDPVIGQEVEKALPIVFLDLDVRIERAIAPGSATVDETLMLDVLRFIEQNPQRWCQHVYLALRNGVRIGCVAGWAVILSGQVPATVTGSVHRMAQVLLGLSDAQAAKIFGFITVTDVGTGKSRHPTFAELCSRVAEVTGVNYNPQEEQ